MNEVEPKEGGVVGREWEGVVAAGIEYSEKR